MNTQSDIAELKSIVRKYIRPVDEAAVSPVLLKIKNDEVLELIKKKKYDKAVELIRMRKLNPFSLFNGVQAFGKIYDNIPFIAAALAVAADKRSKKESCGERISNVLSEVFKRCGGDSKNMFDAKFNTPSGSSDILTFILTRDGEVKPEKYSHDRDLDTLVLLNSIFSNGYSLENISNLTKYVFDNDLISTLKFMVENNMYSPTMDAFETYGIKPTSNIGKMLSVIAAHPFKLHAPEIEVDDKGKFAGGTMYNALKRVGYDISKLDDNKAQSIHPSFSWMIKDAILNAYVNYCNNGENFTNASDICFSDGSKFMDAVEKLLYLCGKYREFANTYGKAQFSEQDRARFLTEIVKSSNVRLLEMQDGLNEILERLNLPKVVFTLNNQLDMDDKKLVYKVVNFMKEIWDSVKFAKRRQQA